MRALPPPGAPPRRSSPTQKPVVSQRATGGAGVPAQKAQPRSSAPDAPVLAPPLGLSQGRLRGRHRNSSLSHAPLHVRLLRDGDIPMRRLRRLLTLTVLSSKQKAPGTEGAQPSSVH